jgi:hypothetical protein
METEAMAAVKSSRWPGIVLAGGAFIGAYFVARYGMWAWAPQEPWDIFVMNIPVLAFFWFVAVVQRGLREADELQRRIHLEALALAFLTVMLLLMGLGLIEEMPRGRLILPWRDLWFALIPLYGICYLAARHRYR